VIFPKLRLDVAVDDDTSTKRGGITTRQTGQIGTARFCHADRCRVRIRTGEMIPTRSDITVQRISQLWHI